MQRAYLPCGVESVCGEMTKRSRAPADRERGALVMQRAKCFAEM